MTPRERMEASRPAQGLPPDMTDPSVADRAAIPSPAAAAEAPMRSRQPRTTPGTARDVRRTPGRALERRRDRLLNVIDHWTLVHDDAARRLREARAELRAITDAMDGGER